MRLEGQLKNPMTSSGIEPAIYRLVWPLLATLPRARHMNCSINDELKEIYNGAVVAYSK
jgi:hypothetical protein